jgi:fructokinase
VPTPRDDYPGTLQTIARLVFSLDERFGSTLPVGVGMPGSVSPSSGRVRNANSTWLNGRAFGDDVRQLLGRDVKLENDANCFALSEARDGAGAGAHVLFGVILGTGVGGGIVIGGQLLSGANAIAGEWGHNPLPSPREDERPGPACYCGRRGCIETFLSGPALVAHTGHRVTSVPALVGAAEAGDPSAEKALQRYEERLARALATIVNVIDPDVIVLGGGVSNVSRLYSSVPKLMPHWVFADAVRTRIVPPKHGDSSGVRGAAWLAAEDARA